MSAKVIHPAPNTRSNRGRKTRLLVGLLVVCAGAGLAVWLRPGVSREPLPEGKPISFWVDKACSAPDEVEARREVRRIGAPAIPYLIAKLKSRESWMDHMQLAIRDRLPTPLSRFLPVANQGPYDRSCAADCLASFGPEAKPAVNALALLARSTNTFITVDADRAIAALGAIGPVAKEALPQLRRALTNQTPLLQVAAAWSLWTINRETNVVLDAFTNIVASGKDDIAAMNAALGLSLMGPAATPAAPTLLTILNNTNHNAGSRGNVPLALSMISLPDAESSARLLTGASDSALRLRSACARALWHIDEQYASSAVPVIVEWMIDWNRQHSDEEQSFTQLEYSDKLNLKAAVPALKKLRNGGSPEARKIADDALRQLESADDPSGV